MESQKITNSDFAKARRWYQDACGTALAMDLIGERWSLLIVRELLLGARRFGEIRGAPANARVYELTRWGAALEEPIFALSRWAAGSPAHDVTLPLSNGAFMLSLKTMMAREPARGFAIDLGFRVGGEPFRATIDDGGLAIERRDPAGADVIFEGVPTLLAATFYGPLPLAESIREGRVAVTGDLMLGQRFVDLFRLPKFEND
jgi:DNA-binding HxlR family transcriptional regulator